MARRIVSLPTSQQIKYTLYIAACLLIFYMNIMGVHCLRMVNNNNNHQQENDVIQDEPLKVEERFEEMQR